MWARVGLVVIVAVLAVLLVPNARSLYEGVVYYLFDAWSYNPTSPHPVNRNGRFGSVYDLVRLTNAERRDYILKALNAPTLTVTQIPVPGSSIPNLFVRFSSQGPYTLFSAHYDKYRDTVDYQGASDNTAADSVLLAAIVDLAKNGYHSSAAFLFVAAEETGLQGSPVFVEYARANNIVVRENVNFDDLGRGNLAIRPSSPAAGYVFSLPFYGNVAFDGDTFHPFPSYPPVDPQFAQRLLRVRPDMVVVNYFTVLSDSNIFQANGIPAVTISGDRMYYLQLTWDTYYDRVELLDETNLDRAFDFVVRYAQAN